MQKRDYRSAYKELCAERMDFIQIGKDRLLESGITFSVFNTHLHDLLVFSHNKTVNPYELFLDLCWYCGNAKAEYFNAAASIEEFVNERFCAFEMSTHGIRLKSKPDDRL